MSTEWVARLYTAKAATTRPTHVAGQDHLVVITRQALEGMVEQFRNGFVAAGYEHLTYIPPMARWYDGDVVDCEDGASELIIKGRELKQLLPRGDDPDPLEIVAALPVAPPPLDIPIELRFEPRNFAQDTLDEIRETCPFPTKEELRWSALPPIEWVLSVPVVWGAIRFAGAFFDELGRASASSLVAWFKRLSARSRDPARDRLVTISFALDDTRLVYGVVPIPESDPNADAMLEKALESVGVVAAFAGAQKGGASGLAGLLQAAFIFDGDRWRFAWWTDGEQVYRTHWFERHSPDPSRFLGRAPFGNEQG